MRSNSRLLLATCSHFVTPWAGSSSPIDLRHMTSNTVLVMSKYHPHSTRSPHSKHPARLDSIFPNPIPFSLASVYVLSRLIFALCSSRTHSSSHSFSSAIFERDIEPISPLTKKLLHHPTNPQASPALKRQNNSDNLSHPFQTAQQPSLPPSMTRQTRPPSSLHHPLWAAGTWQEQRIRSPGPFGTRPGGGGNATSLLPRIPYSNQHLQPHSDDVSPLSVHVFIPQVPALITQNGSPCSRNTTSPS
jgi:hypothetical protein